MFGKSLASLSDSFGSAFNFDFVRNPSRPKRLSGRDMMGSWKLRSAETSPVEPNGSKASDMRLQEQQEEFSRMQQEQAKLRDELAAQKVQLFVWWGKNSADINVLYRIGKVEYRIFSTCVCTISHKQQANCVT